MDDRKFIRLDSVWDPYTVLQNPHKGWYFHYYDNGLKNYVEDPDDLLLDFKGLNHIYLRVDWSDVEPEEGKFNWDLLDSVIEKWLPTGRNVSFRIASKETSPDQSFATPKWVMDAGAKGRFFPAGGRSCPNGYVWQPDYGDPVFLEKLNNFHAAFAEHYDGKPWVEFFDVGSMGEWGEGHNEFSSGNMWPVETYQKHFDIYSNNYKKSLIMGNYSFVVSRPANEEAERDIIWKEMQSRGYGIRCDSICVPWYSGMYSISTLYHPEMYAPFWKRVPVDLEYDHLSTIEKAGNWRNGYPELAATYEAHPTFSGFHGHARHWLENYREFSDMIANLTGYWYFPFSVWAPEHIIRGEEEKVTFRWQNRGVAPAYHKFEMRLRLQGEGTEFVSVCSESDNRTWMPIEMQEESYSIRLPDDLPKGTYQLSFGLFDGERPVLVGLRTNLVPFDGKYYELPHKIIVE